MLEESAGRWLVGGRALEARGKENETTMHAREGRGAWSFGREVGEFLSLSFLGGGVCFFHEA